MKVCELGSPRAARINDNQLAFLTGTPPLLHTLKERWMAFEGVGANNEDAIGVINILVAARRFVLAVHLRVAAGRRRMHNRALASTLLVRMPALKSLLAV